jgi:hydroxyquinol 1,2-dioxygenase
MRQLNEQTITTAALERFSAASDPRLKKVMAALIRHLHDFAREVQLTPEEWHKAIEFLTAVGHITDDRRQEFILLSDTLGLSALVDLIANRGKSARATESSLLGPFFREGAPEMPLGSSIPRDADGEPLMVLGRVSATDGKPVAGATLDVWQAAPNGLYDIQREDPAMDLRARFRTGADGSYSFMTVKTASYPVPHDGPVGAMLDALGRHPYRPAHIHFRFSAPGYKQLITALYMEGDRYLDSDAVFGAREPLVVGYRKRRVEGRAQPIDSIEFDFVLEATSK